MSEQVGIPVSEDMAAMAITKRCPVDGNRLAQINDPDFGLCWYCSLCGYLEPID